LEDEAMFTAWIVGAALGVAGAADRAVESADRSAYEAARASAGRDADALVRLALWCEARGMEPEKTTHLTRAILVDPDHAKARGLLGYVRRDGKWLRPSEAARAVEDSPEQRALLAEYLERRAKTRDSADDQYRLALWCEERGLEQPMAAHLHRTLQLDPRREGAWRRLGYEKSGGRWVDPAAEAAAKAEREALERAAKEWGPRLAAIRSGLASRDRSKREEARSALAAIEDRRAVPSVWKAFVKGGGEAGHRTAVEVFGRIEGIGASTALATLAVFSPHASARADAAGLLRNRDPREFAGYLASLIQDEVKYRVKPVSGPGSTGELLVEGKDANVSRRYTPMQPPQLTTWRDLPMDPSGVATLPVGVGGLAVSSPIAGRDLAAAFGSEQARATKQSILASPLGPYLQRLPQDPPIPQDVTFQPWEPLFSGSQLSQELGRDGSAANIKRLGGPNFRQISIATTSLHIPIGAMIAEARASAVVAREQMSRDVADIEAYNAPIREVNDRSLAILKGAGGPDLGSDRKGWMDWAYELEGRGYALRSPSSTSPPPTYVEEVPIAFQPQARPYTTVSYSPVGYTPSGVSCFAGGTAVRTLRGDRPIEEIRPGDQVLTQDTTTGAFSYRPVVEVFHNPPNATYAVDLGSETVHPTGIHRFWKAGRGWVMARDLEPGDRLRTVGGLVEVASVKKEEVQPVFNLLLAGGDNYCVGSLGVVAHDNSFGEPVATPFDGVPETAELIAKARP